MKEKSLKFSPVDNLDILSDLEKVVKIQAVSLSHETALSTGLLCLDTIMGGGIRPGLATIAGPEQSSKTTTAITAMGAAIQNNVPMTVLWDAENSSGSSTDYIVNIFKTMGLKIDMETVFGVRKNGKYVIPPKVYYRDEGEMETFFGWVSGLLRRLPDKRFEDDKWWYIYENTRENKAKFKDVLDRRMSSANNAVYIEAEDSSLQAYILMDSWPSLLPASQDEDDARSGMALQAREFSKNIPRVKGKLRAKRVAIIGINQIRQKPAVMYGDPSYEPGGEALKFYSDVRIWNKPRALSGVPYNPKGKGQIEEEPSVEGEGVDVYRYIHSKAIKNKLSVPGRETWLRIWVSDYKGEARGFDPVWDTFYTLVLTGQLSGKRSSMLLNIQKLGQAKKNIGWQEFKTLILGTKEEISTVCLKMGYKPVNIRRGLFAMSKSGVLEDLYIKTKMSKKPEGEDEKEED